jgi:TolA-binding protein
MTDVKETSGSGKEHAEDLSALARRRALSEAQERRLSLCLVSSDALRALHDIGCDFDELDTGRPGDAGLVARIAARARTRAGVRGRVGAIRRRGLALWVGGGIVMAGTVAAAMTMLHIVGPPSHERPTDVVRSAEQARRRPAHAAGGRTPANELGASDAHEATAPVPPPGNADRIGAKSVPSLRGASSESAAVEQRASLERDAASGAPALDEPARLFSLANGARRRGEFDRSLGIYQELESRFPGSPEAVLTHVMVGRLQLGRGANTLALVEFLRYLRAEPRGALAQEALEGKARALERLGRVTEERAAWQQLLSRFPNSVYAETARERLGGSH